MTWLPMRLVIAAVGRLKQGPERELAAGYRKRAQATGRSLGFRDIEIVEIRESRAQDVERRRIEESIALANIIPERAIVVVLDQRGENLDSAALAGLLREWRAEDRAGGLLRHRWRRRLGAEPASSAPSSGSPSARRPGRISWCASCCSSSFTAPAPSSPAIPIIGPERPSNYS